MSRVSMWGFAAVAAAIGMAGCGPDAPAAAQLGEYVAELSPETAAENDLFARGQSLMQSYAGEVPPSPTSEAGYVLRLRGDGRFEFRVAGTVLEGIWQDRGGELWLSPSRGDGRHRLLRRPMAFRVRPDGILEPTKTHPAFHQFVFRPGVGPDGGRPVASRGTGPANVPSETLF